MLKLNNVSVSFAHDNGIKNVLNNINLEIQKGEFVVVVGDNGAGKSTLFNVISGSIIPTLGSVVVNNCDVTKTCMQKRAATIAHVLQDPAQGTIGSFTIFENLVLASKRTSKRALLPFYTMYNENDFKKYLEPLGLGLENRLHEKVSSLSGGQRQALSVAMALLINPEILLLDEITAALDYETSIIVLNIVTKFIKNKKCTVLMITHSPEHAQLYGDRVITLKKGNII